MTAAQFKSNRFDLAVDTISRADLEEVIAWLRKYPRLTMGEESKRFEQAWSKWLGVKYSVMCNSGASANLLMYAALESAGRAGKRKVVVPATGWVTDIAPAIQFGWQPIMCESDPVTFGLNMDSLAKILKRDHPENVVLVHVLGVPVNMTRLLALQKQYGFNIIEDCCASHGSRHQGRLVGTFGLISVFSFYYGHHMSTVEGGMLCTNDEHIYHHLLMLRSHGWLKDLPAADARRIMKKYRVDPFHAPFTFTIPGFNLRPTEISARTGSIQLRKLDATIRRRVANHLIYQKRLNGAVDFARGIPGDVISSISFCAVAKSAAQRRKIIETLDKKRIDTRIFTAGNLGRHPFWADRFGVFSAPVADKLYRGGFFLPNNQSLQGTDIEYICGVVRKALE
ncbi:MAG: DegT/DnrJ/EryC1/StrS family aminotransferase [Kiritimatiellaeota bacterium]|nr:DegT/DnrJ/EryC1/StrS family aminotransferase [Kiritimatiellota bacterium]